ncbi:MAG TPA: Mur ligase family protein [Candidatus Dormibacteraeota bacterium]|nr:Mur ligase family protein [Candidatus Dormibacteraeota bacterium]
MAGGAGAQTRLTYEAALEYVSSLRRFGVKLGLDRMHAFLDQLGHPERGKRGALIAGTNGKGSTSAFLESILRARGLHTGLTPSPHLSSYTERVQLDAEPISEDAFAAAVTDLRELVAPVVERMGQSTEFEFLIAMAIWWLAPRTDRLVIEIGMGGRLDSTNALDLGVAVITNVTYDHRRHLGRTVRKIAGEKAGIIKAGNVVITAATGAALSVIEHAAVEARAADLWRLGKEIHLRARWRGWDGSELDVSGPGFSYSDLRIGLAGMFQPANAALAVAAAHALGDATPEAVRQGLAATTWRGRIERVEDRLVLDCAHNQDGMRQLVRSLRRLLGAAPVTVVFAAMADKEVDRVLSELRKLNPAHVVFTLPASASRALAPDTLAEMWGTPGRHVRPASRALARARELAGADGWVVVCGSLFLVGELLSSR